jgi:hypothetical protein
MQCAWKKHGIQCTDAVNPDRWLAGEHFCKFHRQLENDIASAVDAALAETGSATLAAKVRMRGSGTPGGWRRR